ncbi:MAG: 4-(cytidine 5'-diphospho)-2-C-methyl-D-erythritol kinase [Campylobacterota bacterium]
MEQKAYAKVNIFLKITGTRDSYHELLSRFYRVDTLYDRIEFVKTDAKRFEILGMDDVVREHNTIYKAFCALNYATNNPMIIDFFDQYSVKVTKNIPSFAGLGGGSSDAATFMLMCNEILDLRLSQKQLQHIALQIGADVCFFISGFKSANVSGIGEIIEPFEDDDFSLEIFTPPIACSTPKIYKEFRQNHLQSIDPSLALHLKKLKSREILESYGAFALNDLLAPALQLNPSLKEYVKPQRYFSGSGSSFFSLLDN